MLLIGGVMNTISACSMCAPTYNYYVFKITDCCSRFEYNMKIDERLRQEWCKYTGKDITYAQMKEFSELKPEELSTTDNAIVKSARDKGDSEMMEYMTLLATYLQTVEPTMNEWHYFSPDEKEEYEDKLMGIMERAVAYKGKRLKDRYTLLQMRLFMRLDYADGIVFYENGYKKMQNGIFADMMKGYYAGALAHCSKREEAAAIFVELGDMQSARLCLNKTNNVACLEAAVAKNPDSPVVAFMLEEVMNAVQETYDYFTTAEEVKKNNSEEVGMMDMDDWFSMTTVYEVNEQQRAQLMTLCDRMLADKKVKNKQQWMAAKAYLHYFQKDYQTAYDEICQAYKMQGSDAARDCARVLRMLFVAKLNDTNLVESIFMEDLPWLKNKINEQIAINAAYAQQEQLEGNRGSWCLNDNIWSRSAQRVLIHGLAAHYKDHGNTKMYLLAWRMIPAMFTNEDEGTNSDYLAHDYFQYFDKLQELSLEELIAYNDFLFKQKHSKIQQYLIDNGKHTEVAYADVIGTRCLAMGKWQEAIKWMENIPMNYLSNQHIAPYAGMRDYTIERWFDHIDVPESMEFEPYTLTTNKKVDFCRTVMKKEQEYNAATGERRYQLAYELATLYFQASAKGDCWWLARYGVSPASSDLKQNPESTLDFAKKAYDILGDALKTTNKDLRSKVLYARLFIPVDPVILSDYNYDTGSFDTSINTNSSQYKDLLVYISFRASNKNLPAYLTHCDVINDALKACEK